MRLRLCFSLNFLLRRRLFQYLISEMIKSIDKELILIEKSETECLQPAIQEPAHIPNNRDCFIDDYKKFGFEYVAKKYGKNGIKYNIKYFLNNIGILDKLKKIRRGIR